MTIDYDPFSDAAMRDPFPLYAAMRAEGGPHYIAKYNAWALARFEDVWEASMHHEADVTWTAGATPAQLLLGDPIPRAFTTMDAPEHRKWRGVIRREYTPEAVRLHEQRLRTLVREVLDPLLARGEFDAYTDYANRVFCLNSGFNLGLPREDALTWRALIDELMHRDPGQCGGSSSRNQYAATQLAAYLLDYVQTFAVRSRARQRSYGGLSERRDRWRAARRRRNGQYPDEFPDCRIRDHADGMRWRAALPRAASGAEGGGAGGPCPDTEVVFRDLPL